jgi:predicted small metal-binding protein
MPDEKALRCDCGYLVIATDEAGLVEDIRAHAQDAHGIVFSVEDALVVLLRSQLDLSRAQERTERAQWHASKGGWS